MQNRKDIDANNIAFNMSLQENKSYYYGWQSTGVCFSVIDLSPGKRKIYTGK